MKNVLNIGVVLLALVAFAPAAMAGQGGQGQNCERGAPNQNFCGGDGNGGSSNANTNRNTNTNTNRNTNQQGQAQGQHQTATGGTGIGVGVGYADASNRVDASSSNRNTNTAFGGQGGTSLAGAAAIGGDQTTRVSTGDVTTRVSNDSDSRSGVYGSGNSHNYVSGGDTSSRASTGDQSQFGLNLSHNDNGNEIDNSSRSRAVNGDVNGSNTLIIGGQGGDQEGFGGSTLSPEANNSLNVGDTDLSNTNTLGDTTQTVGDTHVTVVNEGVSEEAARALGQPDVVEVDARDLSTENQSIDASTEINDNSSVVYEATKMSAASAAPSFASVCTSGASGQGRSLGLSISVTSPVCEHLMMADAFSAVGESELVMKHLKKAASHANWKGTMAKFRHVITLGIL